MVGSASLVASGLVSTAAVDFLLMHPQKMSNKDFFSAGVAVASSLVGVSGVASSSLTGVSTATGVSVGVSAEKERYYVLLCSVRIHFRSAHPLSNLRSSYVPSVMVQFSKIPVTIDVVVRNNGKWERKLEFAKQKNSFVRYVRCHRFRIC